MFCLVLCTHISLICFCKLASYSIHKSDRNRQVLICNVKNTEMIRNTMWKFYNVLESKHVTSHLYTLCLPTSFMNVERTPFFSRLRHSVLACSLDTPILTLNSIWLKPSGPAFSTMLKACDRMDRSRSNSLVSNKP